MTTLQEYAEHLWTRQKKIAIKSGADISREDKTTRVLNKSLLVLLAAVIKTLVDKGVVTDAELLATLNAARDADYQDEPVKAPPPDPV